MNTTTLLYPNLTTPAQYSGLITQLLNTLMHEPIMVRTRRGAKVFNERRPQLDAKIAAASKEANERFGHKVMNPQAYCSKCGKLRGNKFDRDYNAEVQCHRGQCGTTQGAI